jgi:C4-dicarboxylate-specific signal transduction histidine kinase
MVSSRLYRFVPSRLEGFGRQWRWLVHVCKADQEFRAERDGMNAQDWTRADWLNTAPDSECPGQRPDLFRIQEMLNTLRHGWCASARRAWIWVNARLSACLSLTKATPFIGREDPGRDCKPQRADQSYGFSLIRAVSIRNHEGNMLPALASNIEIDGRCRPNETRSNVREHWVWPGQNAPLIAMSASIAHEINQPLGAIVANAHAASKWLEATPADVSRVKMLIERILRDSRVAADVVQKMLGLLKQQPPAKQLVGLPKIVNQALTILEPEIEKHAVEIVASIPADLPLVFADSLQIQQVLINLISNAIDAVHEASSRDRKIWLEAEPEEDTVAVRVRDTGCGVPDPNLIFETFFTTKAKGAGIGLALSRSIAEANDGSLTVRNGSDCGAEFTLRVPRESGRSSEAGWPINVCDDVGTVVLPVSLNSEDSNGDSTTNQHTVGCLQ